MYVGLLFPLDQKEHNSDTTDLPCPTGRKFPLEFNILYFAYGRFAKFKSRSLPDF